MDIMIPKRAVQPVITVEDRMCKEYRAVFDEMTTKSKGLDRYGQNLFAKRLVQKNLWSISDFIRFYGAHTDENGEHLLDWKQPAGGTDVVINGEFDTDTDWIKGAGWTISGGKAVATAANTTSLSQAGILTIGKTFKITYTISDYSAGIVKPQAGTATGTARAANGTYTDYITCTGNTSLIFYAVTALTCKIDNVSCIPWTNAIAYNDPIHTPREGVLFDGTNQYIDHRFQLDVCGVNYQQNSASQILYIRTDNSISGGHGTNISLDNKDIFINPRYTNDNAYIKTNDGVNINVANTNGSGLYINTRTAAAVNKLYRNGVVIINGTTASTGVPTHSPYTGAYNGNNTPAGFREDQVFAELWGLGLVQAQVNDVTDVINEIATLFGVNVF